MNSSNGCFYCKSAESKAQFELTDIFSDTYTMVRCPSCGAYYLSPHPSEAQLARAYSDSYYGEKETKFNPVYEKAMDFFRGGRARLATRYLPTQGKLLDIGCGNGGFLMSVAKRGNYNVYGLEMPGNSALRAAKHPEIALKVGELSPQTYAPDTFDMITLFHVFEHLANPAEQLEIIQSILKDKGQLIVSFPNIDSNQSRKFKGNWLHLDPPRHLQFFTPTDFVELMKKRGFQLISANYSSMEQNPYGLIQSLLNSWGIKRDLLFESMKGNQSYLENYPKWKLRLQKLFFISFFPVAILVDFYESLRKRGATVQFVFRLEKNG